MTDNKCCASIFFSQLTLNKYTHIIQILDKNIIYSLIVVIFVDNLNKNGNAITLNAENFAGRTVLRAFKVNYNIYDL